MGIQIEGKCVHKASSELHEGDLFEKTTKGCFLGDFYQLQKIRGNWALLNLSGGVWHGGDHPAPEDAFDGSKDLFTKLRYGDFVKLTVR